MQKEKNLARCTTMNFVRANLLETICGGIWEVHDELRVAHDVTAAGREQEDNDLLPSVAVKAPTFNPSLPPLYSFEGFSTT